MPKNEWDKHKPELRWFAGETTNESKSGNSKMTWGKHKGKTLQQIDTKYLKWVLSRDPSPELRNEIDTIIFLRHPKKKDNK